MPRKSAAALAVATITKAPLRTEPPAHLSDEAAALWRAITAAYPPGHFQARTFRFWRAIAALW